MLISVREMPIGKFITERCGNEIVAHFVLPTDDANDPEVQRLHNLVAEHETNNT